MTSDLYDEIECAKLHGGWPAWLRLDVQTRAKLMAHERHRVMRDHYYLDMRKKQEPNGPAAERTVKEEAAWDAVQRRFFKAPPVER